MKYEVSNTDWDSVLEVGDPNCDINRMWSNFRRKMDEIESKFVSMARSKSGKKSETPLDKETISLIKEKNALSRKFVATKDPDIRKRYNRTRNKVVKASVTIVAGFCPEFHPPFLWRSKHKTKMTFHINNLVHSEFPNRSSRNVRSLISTLICI